MIDPTAETVRKGEDSWKRYQQSGDPADLDEAHRLIGQVLHDYPKHPRALTNLALLLVADFKRTGSVADLEEAIHVGRDVAAATPASDPHRVTALTELAHVLHEAGRPDEALAFQQQVPARPD